MTRFASFTIARPGLAPVVWIGLAAAIGACTKTVGTAYEQQSSAGDQTKGALEAGESAAWAAVDRAADYWAGLFRDWLDRSLDRTPDPTIGVSN